MAGLVHDLLFLSDGRLLTVGMTGLRVFDMTTGASARLRLCRPVQNPSGDGTILSLARDGCALLIAHIQADASLTSALALF